jgi:hypothetical protein
VNNEAPRPEVGSLAEEATKLFAALSGWVEEHRPDAEAWGDQVSALGHDLHEHLAVGAPECAYCPVCQLVRAARNTSPEVKAHLAAAGGSLLQALAGMLDPKPAGGSRDRPGDRVEHIDVVDDWPGDDWPGDDWPEGGRQ